MKNEMKQTAVEWLVEQICTSDMSNFIFHQEIKQALAMEKEQMKEMYLKGIENYDPTFKKKSTWTTSKEGKAFMKS